MKPLPVRPEPLEGETLSSWVTRLGHVYGMTFAQFAEQVLRKSVPRSQLDFEPPEKLVAKIAQLTGYSYEDIGTLHTFGSIGRVDTPEGAPYLMEETVVSTLNVSKFADFPPDWRPWVATRGRRDRHCCPICVVSDAVPYPRLHWQWSFISSCPEHLCLLQPIGMLRWRELRENPHLAQQTFRAAPKMLIELDRKTIQGTQTGIVRFNKGRIPINIWLRLLRIVLQEVRGYQYIQNWYELGIIEGAWMRASVKKPKRGLPPTLFEFLPTQERLAQMKTVAAIFEFFERKRLICNGSLAHVLDGARRPLRYDESVVCRRMLDQFVENYRRKFKHKDNHRAFFESSKKSPILWRALRDTIAEPNGLDETDVSVGLLNGQIDRQFMRWRYRRDPPAANRIQTP